MELYTRDVRVLHGRPKPSSGEVIQCEIETAIGLFQMVQNQDRVHMITIALMEIMNIE